MRNGNLGDLIDNAVIGSRSYRTYEEWKRQKPLIKSIWIVRSYRTYEEWKHIYIVMEDMGV